MKCKSCNKNKNADKDFYTKKNKSTCKLCIHQQNAEFKRLRRIKNKIKAIEYKGATCNDCKKTYPELDYPVWDFHHKNPFEKEFHWKAMKDFPWEKIATELDKCILLCANCHRMRHYSESNEYTG